MDLVIRQQQSRLQFLLRANTTIQDVNSTGSFARLVGVKLRLNNCAVEVALNSFKDINAATNYLQALQYSTNRSCGHGRSCASRP